MNNKKSNSNKFLLFSIFTLTLSSFLTSTTSFAVGSENNIRVENSGISSSQIRTVLPSNLTEMPVEIIELFFESLSLNDLTFMSKTSRQFRELATAHVFRRIEKEEDKSKAERMIKPLIENQRFVCYYYSELFEFLLLRDESKRQTWFRNILETYTRKGHCYTKRAYNWFIGQAATLEKKRPLVFLGRDCAAKPASKTTNEKRSFLTKTKKHSNLLGHCFNSKRKLTSLEMRVILGFAANRDFVNENFQLLLGLLDKAKAAEGSSLLVMMCKNYRGSKFSVLLQQLRKFESRGLSKRCDGIRCVDIVYLDVRCNCEKIREALLNNKDCPEDIKEKI